MEGKKNLVLPNFLCIGAQKTGTTTLYHILKNHPEITVSKPRKETKFFYRDEEYRHGLEFYSKFFSYDTPRKAIGEFDPDYLYFDYVPERIFRNLGKDVKFIVMFRHPVDRAYSQYHMSVLKSWEEKSFDEAIQLEEQRIQNGNFVQKNNFSYVTRGLYAVQLERYFKFFPKENFLFINYDEEFKKDLPATVKKILSFLNVSDIEMDTNISQNEASVAKSKTLMKLVQKQNPIRSLLSKVIRDPQIKRRWKKKLMAWNRKRTEVIPLNADFRNELYKKYFHADILKLEKMTGMNLSSWNKKKD